MAMIQHRFQVLTGDLSLQLGVNPCDVGRSVCELNGERQRPQPSNCRRW